MKDDFTNGCDEPDDQRGRHYDVFEETAAFAQVLAHTGILKTIQNEVHFARAPFGYYDVIDFVAALIGYILSGEPTILAYYERLTPFASEFMVLFGRNRLPHRSTLSRFLASLDQTSVEALRTLCAKRSAGTFTVSHAFRPVRSDWKTVGGDRCGWNSTGGSPTCSAANGSLACSPSAVMPCVCAPGYQGRKRGEVVRTRSVVLQTHTHQLLGTFGGPGNGDYRGELRRAIAVITSYATPLGLSPASMLVRLDGLYGDAAPLRDVLSAGLGVITRSRAYHLLELPVVKQTLTRSPDDVSTHEDESHDASPLQLRVRALDANWT